MQLTRNPARALALTVLLLSACDTTQRNAEQPPADAGLFSGPTLNPPRAKPDFTLTSTTGAPYPFRRETDGKLTLLFFGYTYCPDVCPLHMANIAAVYKKLSYDDQQRIRVVFVTTDPDRDTPQRLRSWLDNFHPAFVGLAGPVDQVNILQQSMGMPPAARETTPDGSPAGSYGVAHGAAVLAFTPDDSLRVLYPFGIRQQDWAKDIPLLLKVKARS